jgi:hypothetical protein
MVKEKNKETRVKSHYLEHETNIETEGAPGLIDSKIFHTTDVGFKLRNLHWLSEMRTLGSGDTFKVWSLLSSSQNKSNWWHQEENACKE